MKLEQMNAFFAARVDGYDEHMRTTIEGASDFYAYTASLLPMEKNARVLDLGCGTGLELEEYFRLNPDAVVTGIDLSDAMLNALKAKFPDRKLSLVQGSYFDVPFGEDSCDAGCFVLTDYFAESEAQEKELFRNLKQLKLEQGLPDNVFFHYDTPLTVEHETQVLEKAGFSEIRIMKNWGHTFTLLAKR